MTATTSDAVRVRTVVVGGGPAGLATSHGLVAAGVPHVVLERARVAERWRTERWDSLRLLTPNWMSRLPGLHPTWDDDHGYMTADQVVQALEAYADSFDAPVVEHAPVEGARRHGERVHVDTPGRTYVADQLVIATGATGRPVVPLTARAIDPRVHQLHSRDYRRPGRLPDGGVLVVGAAASGVQIADELARAGRDVLLAVGRHTRLPRSWRGVDVHWWLRASGALDRPAHDVRGLPRHEPSPQLVGRPGRPDLDLAVLRRRGVRLAGRLVHAAGTSVRFADDLAHHVLDAEVRLDRLLRRFDVVAGRFRWPLPTGRRPAPVAVPIAPPTRVDLHEQGITTVLWATGFRPSNPWLDLDVRDGDGRVRHRDGATAVTGVHVLGLPWTRRRDSTFLAGIGRDARLLVAELVAGRAARPRARPSPSGVPRTATS